MNTKLFFSVLLSILLFASCSQPPEERVKEEFMKFIKEKISDSESIEAVESVSLIDTLSSHDIKDVIKKQVVLIDTLQSERHKRDLKVVHIMMNYGTSIFNTIPGSQQALNIYLEISENNQIFIKNVASKVISIKLDESSGIFEYKTDLRHFLDTEDFILYEYEIKSLTNKNGKKDRFVAYCRTDEEHKLFDFDDSSNLSIVFDRGCKIVEILKQIIEKTESPNEASDLFLKKVFEYETGRTRND